MYIKTPPSSRRPYRPQNMGGAINRVLTFAARKGAEYGVRSLIDSDRTNSANVGVTGQYDSRTVYRKRRARKGKAARIRRKRAKRSRRSWTKNLIRTLGSTAIVLNDAYGASLTGTASQTTAYATLYGYDGSAIFAGEIGEKDMKTVMTNNGNINEQTEKAVFSNGFLDLTFHNTSTQDTKMEVDVYWLKFRRSAELSSVAQAFIDAANVTALPAGNTDGVDFDLGYRGTTPFQFPVALSKGISVIKKTKHFVPKGSYFTTQWKDTKPHWLSMNDAAFADNLNNRGIATTAMVVVKNIIGTPNDQVGTFSIGVTRTYNVKWLENNKTYNAYIANSG